MEENKLPIKNSTWHFLNFFFSSVWMVYPEGFCYYHYYFLDERPVDYRIRRKRMQLLRCTRPYFVNTPTQLLLAPSTCGPLFIQTFELDESVINPIKYTFTQKKNMLYTSFLKIPHASGWSLPTFAAFSRGPNPLLWISPLHFHSRTRQVKYSPRRESVLVPPGSIFWSVGLHW